MATSSSAMARSRTGEWKEAASDPASEGATDDSASSSTSETKKPRAVRSARIGPCHRRMRASTKMSMPRAKA